MMTITIDADTNYDSILAKSNWIELHSSIDYIAYNQLTKDCE